MSMDVCHLFLEPFFAGVFYMFQSGAALFSGFSFPDLISDGCAFCCYLRIYRPKINKASGHMFGSHASLLTPIKVASHIGVMSSSSSGEMII